MLGRLLVPVWHTMPVAKIFHLEGVCSCVCACMEGEEKREEGEREKEEVHSSCCCSTGGMTC